ncbi:hypothetical protein [Curtobacterium sp. Arg-1]|uniref:hypothetical protein n=1 Tax=Curtobacterium sp. Arg-1 TaxID=2935040 RepID=UPI0021DB3FD2|nr:hypothetical protein [Curtobacterium sp. Arg-1]UXZ57058.1 hypothetical protein MXD64_13770 [Curtobacterium sp. Arg-1]
MTTTNQHFERSKEALEASGDARVAGKYELASYYLGVSQAQAALALVEEQRTANLVAAYNGDLLKNPHPVGSHEHDVWWAKTAGDLTERVGVQR